MKTPGKYTHNIISLLLLALIWNLECKKMSGPSLNEVKKIEPCDSTEGHMVKVERYRINKYNQTVYTYDGNIELLTELTNEGSVINISVEKWGNGGWKRNFFRKIPNACSALEKFAPNYIRSIMKQANITGCPIPEGNYVLKDLVINVDVSIPIPYGLYRCHLDLFQNGTIIFCIRFILDVVPLE